MFRFIDRPEAAETARRTLIHFYGALKTHAKMIGNVILTGAGRFANTTLLSVLDNLNDLTFDERYAGICGFTGEDLDALLDWDRDGTLKALVDRGDLPEGSGRGELRRAIWDWYGGYSWDGETAVCNPLSTLSLLKEAAFRCYWYESGSTKFLKDLIRKAKVPFNYMERELEIIHTDNIIDHIDLLRPSVWMFQTGYMTIKERIPGLFCGMESFQLGAPNREVAMNLVPELLSTKPPNRTPAGEAIAKSVFDGLLGLDQEGFQKAFGDHLRQFGRSRLLEHGACHQALLELALRWAGQEIESRHVASGVFEIVISGRTDRLLVEVEVFGETRPERGVRLLPPTDPADAASLRMRMAPTAEESLKRMRERCAGWGIEPARSFEPGRSVEPGGRVNGMAVVVARRTFVLARIERDVLASGQTVDGG